MARKRRSKAVSTVLASMIFVVVILVYIRPTVTLRGAKAVTYAKYAMSQIPLAERYFDREQALDQVWVERALYDGNAERHATAVHMVTKFGCRPLGVRTLLAASRDGNPGVRARARRLLRRMEETEVLPP